ncbi:ABC transporter ATP-binding protein [Anaerobacillus alkaliphilus]|uniref:ABC transporter ATP-binding protein n=1 Tax=Anaerobacillus alkaliphilus TaxID=1548597 RepID=A0A4Q0VMT3_9BACI|nr:ABC transporter ATP-binding protein [Anaerobacillus alkaliphilus]RXI96266.1 ABC transporter ATP-binding protein [Anaerobacillus alkaliphilus]
MARNKFDIDEELEAPFQLSHFKRLVGYLKPYKKLMIMTVCLMLLASVANLIGPYLIKVAIDEKIPNGDTAGLAMLAGIYLVAIIITGICLKYRIRIMSRIGQSVIQHIRKDLFTKLQKLDFSYYDSRPHGKILVRVVNYVNSLSDLLSNGVINLITDLFSIFVIICFMLMIDVKLTLMAMVGFPILALIVFLIKNAQRRAWQNLSNKQSNMNAYIHESINGIKVTQAFAREHENARIFNEVSGNYRTSWMKAVRIQFLLWPSIENISVLSVSFIYVVGISAIGDGVTVGSLVAFVGYMWMFWMPLANIGNFYNAIINAMAYLERIFETIDEKPTLTDAPNAKTLPVINGRVEFDNVTFGYEREEKTLDQIQFVANPGDTIALVGATGSGKTTIVNLISRFYDVNSGQVKIDDIDIKTVTIPSLRKQMGIMLQDPFIFSGTIMDNIRYGRLDASDEEVIAAAKAVQAHQFISRMEDGYLTEVNERGTRLSTGQRQLISFARVLLADPRILILDEATSSIDTETELALQKGLETLLAGRTSFIIAHRLSTIQKATNIFFIDKGKIIERGTHDELISQRGHYWKLHNSHKRAVV